MQLFVLADSDSMQQQICTKERKWEKRERTLGEGALGCDIAHGGFRGAVRSRQTVSPSLAAVSSRAHLQLAEVHAGPPSQYCEAINCQGEDACYSCLSRHGVK